MEMKMAKYGSVLSVILLSGCATLAPEYERPAMPVSAQLPVASEQAVVAPLKWQDFIQHPELRQLVELALENNRDLRTAALNVQRARALYRIEQSAQLPSVDVTASGNHQGLSASQTGTGSRATSHGYSAGLGFAAYELDLFGRVSNLEEQALQQYFATEQGRRASRLSLIANVSDAYLQWTADRNLLNLAKETLHSQQEAYGLQKQRYERGILSELELTQVQTQVDAAKVEVARLNAAVTRDASALALLLGTQVPQASMPTEPLHQTDWFSPVSAGLSSEVLLHRPDVIQAEHQLRAANANIGVARAAFFPRISLTAGIGSASGDLSDLFSGSAQTWQFIPSLNLPIFNSGRNKANLKVAEVDQQISQANYEKTIQAAFREVADSLSDALHLSEQLQAQRSLTKATAHTYELAKLRYEQGIDSYLQVLDAQRSTYQAQQNLVQLELAHRSTQLGLYKALGGEQ